MKSLPMIAELVVELDYDSSPWWVFGAVCGISVVILLVVLLAVVLFWKRRR